MVTGIGLGILLILLLGLYVKTKQALRYWPIHYDAQYRVITKDGWTLDLYRYNNPQQADSQGVIILCHDIGCSPRIWEEDGPDSWSLQLKHLGYDVWCVGLRGTDSSRPQFLDATHGWGWRIEEHLYDDLPAILDTISHHCPDAPVHWIGHGLGGVLGLLANAHLSRTLRSITTLHVGLGAVRRFRLLTWLLHIWPLPYIPLRRLFRWLIPLRYLWKRFRKMTQRVWKRSVLMFEDPQEQALIQHLDAASAPLFQQWIAWLHQGKWHLSATQSNLHLQLPQISCQVLCISVPTDVFAPEQAVKRLWQSLPESQRSFYNIRTSGQIEQQFVHPLPVVSPKTPSPRKAKKKKKTTSSEVTSPESQPSTLVLDQTSDGKTWPHTQTMGRGHYAALFHRDLRKHLISKIHQWHRSLP